MIKNDIKVWLIKQMLIALLCVGEFSGTKFMSLIMKHTWLDLLLLI